MMEMDEYISQVCDDGRDWDVEVRRGEYNCWEGGTLSLSENVSVLERIQQLIYSSLYKMNESKLLKSQYLLAAHSRS